MLKDKEGNRLFRKVSVKVIYPDNIFPVKTFTQHAGPKQGFGPTGVDDILMKMADQLDTLYPWWDFTCVELKAEHRTKRYVFTFAGYRSTTINPKEDGTTLDTGAAEENTSPAIEAVGNTLQDLWPQNRSLIEGYRGEE
jgi:hypothetical protein